MANDITPIDIERASEKIRQEKETFNQRKRHDNLWFFLKLIMGFFSIILLAGIAIIATYILLNNKYFPSNVVNSAGVALFGDVAGLIISVWKIVLNPKSVTKLEPVTKDD